MGAEPDASKPEEGKKEDEKKKESSEITKKMIRIMTVMAYMAGVSGPGFLLALYYIFFFDPNITGVRPPGYLRSGEMVGLPQARTAPMPQALVAPPSPGYHKKMSREFMAAYFRNLTAQEGDGRIESANNYDDSNPTPKVMALMPETNTGHKSHYNGQTTQFTNMHHNTGSSPQHQDIPPETSPTGSPYVADAIQNEQEHGQPPLPAASA